LAREPAGSAGCIRRRSPSIASCTIPGLTSEIFDALFEAGCDDATMSSRDGVVSLAFGRAAPSMKEAIVSAIRDVRKANIGARVVRVEASELDSTEGIDGEILRLIEA
jgi:hypothetical protein